MRPEIVGFVLGALIAAYLFKEFRPRAGSAPIVRFVLGVFAMIGALVFLGCPWRAWLRLSGGDFNALVGLLGLFFGIWIGTRFLKAGYNLGRSQVTYTSVGWLLPLIMSGFFILMLIYPQVQGEEKSGVLFYSIKGPGSMHAPVIVSLADCFSLYTAGYRLVPTNNVCFGRNAKEAVFDSRCRVYVRSQNERAGFCV